MELIIIIQFRQKQRKQFILLCRYNSFGLEQTKTQKKLWLKN